MGLARSRKLRFLLPPTTVCLFSKVESSVTGQNVREVRSCCPVPDFIFEKVFNLELRGSTAGTGYLGVVQVSFGTGVGQFSYSTRGVQFSASANSEEYISNTHTEYVANSLTLRYNSTNKTVICSALRTIS
jgi:hypothetical protein